MHHASIGNSLCSVMLLESFSGFSLVRFVDRKSKIADFVDGMVQELKKIFNVKVKNMTCINGNKVK